MKCHLLRLTRTLNKEEQMQHIKSMLLQQFKLNLVAVISLVTALSGFMYNNWRDHQNELNQNMRDAAFEVLKDLGELQTIVNYAHFDANSAQGHPIEGWKHAIQVRDLSLLLNTNSAKQGQALFELWQQDWENLSQDSATEQRISRQIMQTRASVLQSIEHLD